jgi:hypothetical protein
VIGPVAVGALAAQLSAPPPFPLVVAQAVERAFIAPGVGLARYDVMTNRGPLVIRVVTIDPQVPSARVATVIAHDRLISAGETVSSMARRTGAVAGINADYFDIGQTNQPLGIVVRNGVLVRSPSRRATLSVGRDQSARFGSYRFSGTAAADQGSWQLGGVDEWPAQGSGTVLLLPAFGPVPARPGGAFAVLEPVEPPGTSWSGTYRVSALDRSGAARPPSFGLAFAPGAVASGALPQAGATVTIAASLDPPLGDVAAALGGGPQLVRDGQPFADPDPPSPAEALQHDPQAGAFALGDGTLAFAEVDGRMADVSIGLTRPEFAALLIGLGASDAIGFDSGGSATLVARSPGDALPTVQNAPSDGVERPVADGFFVYSDAPRGPPARLAVRPATVRIVVGAAVAPYAIVVDGAGHPLQTTAEAQAAAVRLTVAPSTLGRITADGRVVGLAPGTGTVTVRAGGLEQTVYLQVLASVARLRLDPARANPDPGGTVRYRALGFDPAGSPVELGSTVAWTAQNAIVDAGLLRVGDADAVVVARAGGRRAEATVRVGRRTVPIAIFSQPVLWRPSTYPPGGTASAALSGGDGGDQLLLGYDFSGGTRAAYAGTQLDFGGEPLGFSLDIRGDASGGGVRAAFLNSRGERVLVTVAKRIDWTGWQRRTVGLPPSAVPPLRLASLYLVSSLGGPPAHGAGTVGFRDFRVYFAGSVVPTPAFSTPR